MKSWLASKRPLLVCLGACLLVPFMLRWFEHHQVYHPSRVLDASGAELGRPFEDVYFPSTDGVQLNGWFFPANTNSSRNSIVVLLCHGNAGNISHRLEMTDALLSTGVNVFVFDYRGYGRSEGHPSEEGTYRDAEGAYAWLHRKGFKGKDILLFGESLGGGVAAELASRLTNGGLILQSTFTCIADIGGDLFPWLPVRWLAHIKYDTLSKLPRVKAPVLVMHSRTDRLIRFKHSERNFAAANEPKLFCELAGDHNDPLTNREQFVADFQQFLSLIARGKSQANDVQK
ncbi:MAG TPA: alpha/beta hydrolase [Patescibacteria group bacterium]|nr:alpha/beta hydrolase [Patescibacteria group bacterium]